MTNNADLYDLFAKGVRSFDFTEASVIADTFADLTFTQEDQPSSALYCESMTWRLLSVLTKTKNTPNLHRLAHIKQWISSIKMDPVLLQKIEEHMDVEDEISLLFRKNHFVHDVLPRKRQKTDQITEKEYKDLYMKLRTNDLQPLPIYHQDVSRNYMLNGYLQYQTMVLENQQDEIDVRERSAWKKSVQHELQDSTGKDKRVFYSALAGEALELYDSVGNTWEDIIWIYLNSQIESGIDHQAETDSFEQIAPLALSKDDIMDRNDPRILFHSIQTALLSKTPQEIIKKIYHIYYHQQIQTMAGNQTLSSPPLYISEDKASWDQLLRFVSTLILYGHEYLGWKENMYSAALLTEYANLNADPLEPKPVVIATYASKLSPQYQIQIYSHFLQEFDGDDEECMILLQLGKEFNLDMNDILQYTHTHLFKKAIELSSYRVVDAQKDKIEFETEGEIDKSSQILFKSIHWLTLDEHMCVQAFEAANLIIRYFLGICKIYLAQHVFDFFSDILIEHMAVASQKTMRAHKVFKEFNAHKKLVFLFIDYKAWKQLVENEPQDNGSLEDLILIHQWKDRVEVKLYPFCQAKSSFLLISI
ncbi:107-domain-containing protein [Choanephora cucurbitarum]|nr:107-domain-containing protein [Choanephora cucurbitarum]